MAILNSLTAMLGKDPNWNAMLVLGMLPVLVYGLGFMLIPLMGHLGLFPHHAYTGMP